jgi:hypothetical protein
VVTALVSINAFFGVQYMLTPSRVVFDYSRLEKDHKLAFCNRAAVAAEKSADYVGGQVGTISHADPKKCAGILEYDRAETARQGFRQSRCDFGANIEMLEVDGGNLKLPGERAADLHPGDIPGIDEDAAELAPARLFLVEGGLEFLLRQQFLVKKDLA